MLSLNKVETVKGGNIFHQRERAKGVKDYHLKSEV